MSKRRNDIAIREQDALLETQQAAPSANASNTDLTQVIMTSKDPTYWKNIALAVLNEYKMWKRRFLSEHQENISKNLMFEELNNEFKALLHKKSVEVPKVVHEEVMTLFSAHKDIQEVVKEVSPRSWFKITRNIVILALGALLIFGAIANDNFRKLLNDNAALIAIVAIAAVVAYLYYDRKKGK
jgi:hypothetical protein